MRILSIVLAAGILSACGTSLVGESPEEKARAACRTFDGVDGTVELTSDKVADLRAALKRQRAAATKAQEAADSDSVYSELSTAYDAYVVDLAEGIDAMAAFQAGDVSLMEFADLMPDIDQEWVRTECRELFSPSR